MSINETLPTSRSSSPPPTPLIPPYTQEQKEKLAAESAESVKKASQVFSEKINPDIDDDEMPLGELALGKLSRHSPEDQARLAAIVLRQNSADPVVAKAADQELLSLAYPEDVLQCVSQVRERLIGSPALFLKLLRQFPVSPNVKANWEAEALNKLAEISKKIAAEAKPARGSKFSKQGYIGESKEVKFLNKQANRLAECAEKSEEEKEKKRQQWIKDITSYYQSALTLSDYDKLRKFYDCFQELRTRNCKSFEPYLPILTYLAGRIPPADLKEIIKQSRDVNPYLTYACTLHYLSVCRSIYEEKGKQIYENVDVVFGILKETYPEDVLIPSLREAYVSPSNTSTTMDFKIVSDGLEEALNKLAYDQTKEAISSLKGVIKCLCGFSTPHRYLALACALAGDLKKAEKSLHLSLQLLDLYKGKIVISSYLLDKEIKMLKRMLRSPYSDAYAVPQISTPDPLAEFIKLIKCKNDNAQFRAQTLVFISVCLKSLQNETTQVAFIYFGFRWLAENLVFLPHGHRNDQELDEALSNFLCHCARMCLGVKVENTDPWIGKTFEQTQNEDGSIQVKYELTAPKFLDNFTGFTFWALEPSNRYDIGTLIMKQVYSILWEMMLSELMTQCTDKLSKLPLPAEGNFLGFVIHGIKEKSERVIYFPIAVDYVRRYVQYRDNPPFKLSPKSIEWAKLGIFYHEHLPRSSDVLETQIHLRYYAESFEEHFERLLKPIRNVTKGNSALLRRALRDALNASKRIETLSPVFLPSDNDSLYTVCQLAMRLFSWHLCETFEEWGQRLSDDAEMRCFQSEVALLKNDSGSDQSGSRVFRIGDSLLPFNKVRDIWRAVLKFWIEFHKKTTAKNSYIAAGGDEEDSDKKQERQDSQWHAIIPSKTLAEIIEKNSPTQFKGYNKLSESDKKSFDSWVAEKHKHAVEIKEIQSRWNVLNQNDSDDDVAVMAAAYLMDVTEEDRKMCPHSVFVNSESIARSVYQIMLRASCDRILYKMLVAEGPERWYVSDFDKPEEIVTKALECLVGKFHGPEKHCSGNGPMQMHYNAAAFPSSETPINTHIFFPESA